MLKRFSWPKKNFSDSKAKTRSELVRNKKAILGSNRVGGVVEGRWWRPAWPVERGQGPLSHLTLFHLQVASGFCNWVAVGFALAKKNCKKALQLASSTKQWKVN